MGISVSTKGYCKYCGKMYVKNSIVKHIASCKERAEYLEKQSGKTTLGYYTLFITDKTDPQFFLAIDVKESASLKDLDTFLREIWMEPSEYFSEFRLGDVIYSKFYMYYREGFEVYGLDFKLKDILKPKDVLEYTFDFDHPTELLITVNDVRIGKSRRDKIVIESRNQKIRYMCSFCEKKEAHSVLNILQYKGNLVCCDDCLNRLLTKKLKYAKGDLTDILGIIAFSGKKPYLPIINSPRMCGSGYVRSAKYAAEFMPDKRN